MIDSETSSVKIVVYTFGTFISSIIILSFIIISFPIIIVILFALIVKYKRHETYLGCSKVVGCTSSPSKFSNSIFTVVEALKKVGFDYEGFYRLKRFNVFPALGMTFPIPKLSQNITLINLIHENKFEAIIYCHRKSVIGVEMAIYNTRRRLRYSICNTEVITSIQDSIYLDSLKKDFNKMKRNLTDFEMQEVDTYNLIGNFEERFEFGSRQLISKKLQHYSMLTVKNGYESINVPALKKNMEIMRYIHFYGKKHFLVNNSNYEYKKESLFIVPDKFCNYTFSRYLLTRIVISKEIENEIEQLVNSSELECLQLFLKINSLLPASFAASRFGRIEFPVRGYVYG